ncbi:MAG: hypothetical protein CSA34_07110 [Desulfobulbus propionicus]|nr:MAG: hypothetical protein CSA34_07110 [Desulfobulbus propionicus]
MKIKFISWNYREAGLSREELTVGKVYTVIGIEGDFYRILNDEKQPFLYEKEMFDVVDYAIPENWIRTEYDDNEFFIEPPELSSAGFYEDYFDGKAEPKEKLSQFLKSFIDK